MRWQELALRSALIVSPFGAVASGLPAWLTAPLSLLSIATTAELAVRPYAVNVVDRVLLGCGAVVTTLILLGIVLNLTPWGLTLATWNLAWLIVSAGVLWYMYRPEAYEFRPEDLQNEQVTVAPVVAPGYAGAAVQGHF